MLYKILYEYLYISIHSRDVLQDGGQEKVKRGRGQLYKSADWPCVYLRAVMFCKMAARRK